MRAIMVGNILWMTMVVFALRRNTRAVEYPGVAPGPANALSRGHEISVSNKALEASWTISETGLKFERLKAVQSQEVQSLGSEVFRVVLGNGTVYRASTMEKAGPVTVSKRSVQLQSPRVADQTAGQQIEVPLVSSDGRLHIIWRAILLDGTSYVRQEIDLSVATESVEIREIVWLDEHISNAMGAGSVDGSLVIAGPFFLGCEDPMAVNRVQRAQVELGAWSPTDFQTGRRQQKRFPLDPVIATAATFDVAFQYERGPHRVDIHGVTLIENGQAVSSDQHHGYAGGSQVDNVFHLKAPEWKANASYEVVAELDTDPGFELPADQTVSSYGKVVCRGGEATAVCRLPRNASLNPGEVLTQSFVVGVAPKGQLRRAFLCYLERERAHPYRTHLHYNSWYDIAWKPFALNEENCLQAIRIFGERLMGPHDVVVDSMVFDDGWDDPQTLWEFHSRFPHGFTPLAEACRDCGTQLGVWLSPFGGYGEPRRQRLEFGRAQGYEINEAGFSLAGPKYYEAFKRACVKMIQEYGVNHFKFDGIAKGMQAQGGGQYVRDTEAMRRLMLELRQERSDLYINLTTGSWPSPFWLRYADSLWRQGHDMGFAGPGPKQQQWLTYRDQEVYRNIVRRGPLYPLNALMTQGVAYSRQGYAGDPSFDSAGFKDDVRAFFGSGTSLQELYIQPDKLTKSDWRVLAEAAKWSRAQADVLVDTHWIGGDPSKLEVYGYASWSPRKGIVMLRNPSQEAQSYQLDVQVAFELPPGATQAFALKSPWEEDASRQVIAADAGQPLTISLRPFETAVFEATPVVQ